MRSIVLVGFMAAGKSKIGALLADRLGLPFVDTDRIIEASSGMSVAEFFRDRGEAEFRRAERDLVAELLAQETQVIALGGGAFIDEENRRSLNAEARTVWLDTPFGLILSRLEESRARPLALEKSETELRLLFEERRSFYRQAYIRIDPSSADPDAIVAAIVGALNQGSSRAITLPKRR